MRGETIRMVVGGCLLVTMMMIGFSPSVKDLLMSPTSLTIFEGEQLEWLETSSKLSQAITVSTNESKVAFEAMPTDDGYTKQTVTGVEEGTDEATIEVAGIPIKKLSINTLPKMKVVPGGQSIGVKVNTDGVLVVGHHLIHSENGEKSPGELAGIRVGDRITKLNDKEIQHMDEVGDVVQAAGEGKKPLKVEIRRGDQTLVRELSPLKNKGESTFRMGLYIRDSAAGVGTLTFYDPVSKKYGALGHVISDVDTKKPIVVHDGQIIRSSVTSIDKGSNGDPGEKLASFSNQRNTLGTIEKNSSFGIFGTLTEKDLKNHVSDEALPVTLSNHVKEGPAKILTVVEGEKVEEFDIEIVSSVPQKQPATKGLVIKVTDPKLLNTTGGIVQGMSGSPIIQDGKLVGAVTHVFVNDPTSGYGCHISWMLEEAGITFDQSKAKAS
ncbi:SpoIVB peptidase [Halalkalibacterium halodurans]|uniref:Intercompartmental signalling of pro-sigma-K processing/activation n=1 Tax=Halalkalibacterium halodurans (strain ATCC BAA-125 / DSM 18197 / FERM 7344 / JCM 9153 / C-125) TaxID=272558 RepID=Q9K975_HALH5|nr:SpoIVB peptidase [Halalkalibacterium halodurans]MED4122594.1 SpoIVB peptidase [Halalkalibacterium halodurans]MED4174165.1 SpoIVB peptidase [Halalkalibacterium halodurans]BAB06494.1 intercompartmental signalling of pro-sigma-K processing/activation [Halalkalibacterium halodurans C-125]